MENRNELISIDAKTPVLNILFDHYFESRGADDPQTEKAYRNFCHTILDVDPVVADEIMSCAAVLCMEHERAGFIAGVKTRICLDKELSE